MNDTAANKMRIVQHPSLPKLSRSWTTVSRSTLRQGDSPLCVESPAYQLSSTGCAPLSLWSPTVQWRSSSHETVASPQTPPNIFLVCLVFSDLFVGLVMQPCHVCFRLSESTKHFVPRGSRIVYSESFLICYGVSFLT